MPVSSNVRPHNRRLSMNQYVAAAILNVVFSTMALAGPLEGDFVGYRLGATYPITAATRGRPSVMGAVVIRAESTDAAPYFRRVEVMATPGTFTIVSITAVADFAERSGAEALEAKYTDLLTTLYRQKCTAMPISQSEVLKLQCSTSYELTVFRSEPSVSGEGHELRVNLKFSKTSAAWKRLSAQHEREVADIEAAGKRERLERALREGGLTGLK